MSAQTILTALRTKDYHGANESFAQTMQQKLADALAAERKHIFTEQIGLKPEVVPAADIQRVWDENGDLEETEILCNINGLKTNCNGEVTSFSWN